MTLSMLRELRSIVDMTKGGTSKRPSLSLAVVLACSDPQPCQKRLTRDRASPTMDSVLPPREGRVALLDSESDCGCNNEMRAQEERSMNLREAVAAGSIEDVSRCIADGEDVNVTVDGADTALYTAVKSGAESIVKLLIEKGANVNQESSPGSGWRPLTTAVDNGHLGIVEALLSGGADPHIYWRYKGAHPLSLALHNMNAKRDLRESFRMIVQLLLERGANPNIPDGDRRSFLHYCKDRDLLELALSKSGRISGYEQEYESPILFSHCDSRERLAVVMAGKGADLEVRDEDGFTPLLYSCRHRHYDSVAFLLEAGANPNVEIAYAGERVSVIRILKQRIKDNEDAPQPAALLKLVRKKHGSFFSRLFG